MCDQRMDAEKTKVIVPRIKNQFLSLNAYDRHKKLINDYLLCRRGSTRILQRDTSRDRRDIDVIRENHRFLWEEEDKPQSWGENLAKKYYDKLFKEYCICDLSRYKENKVALRWRIENEVIEGRGQFQCGNKKCLEKEGLKTWEVNFAYCEGGEKKNALVKLSSGYGLCPPCSDKLNYHSKKREVTKRKRRQSDVDAGESTKKRRMESVDEAEGVSTEETEVGKEEGQAPADEKEEDSEANLWKTSAVNPEEDKSRDREFEEYLEDLFM
ncbi:hypothetical protein J437_LFUL015536 [Ladona fulva]|uniref:Protein FRA10AC1 n=1 Tax=Ladona fulva TaxID=123851 RepID=A0A8K0KIZ1_LADFU|nr:hypothetical protein J437_LFUL015536 [Ladona fulva]